MSIVIPAVLPAPVQILPRVFVWCVAAEGEGDALRLAVAVRPGGHLAWFLTAETVTAKVTNPARTFPITGLWPVAQLQAAATRPDMKLLDGEALAAASAAVKAGGAARLAAWREGQAAAPAATAAPAEVEAPAAAPDALDALCARLGAMVVQGKMTREEARAVIDATRAATPAPAAPAPAAATAPAPAAKAPDYAAIAALVAAGSLTPAEGRAALGLPPLGAAPAEAPADAEAAEAPAAEAAEAEADADADAEAEAEVAATALASWEAGEDIAF